MVVPNSSSYFIASDFGALVERRLNKFTSIKAVVDSLMRDSVVAKREGRERVDAFVRGYVTGKFPTWPVSR